MKIIYGPKGTGKTKIAIEQANQLLETAKGHVVFITDTNRYMYDLKYQVRFLDITQFAIQNEDAFRGFVKGIVAANADNEYIFIDGIARIVNKGLAELEAFFAALDKLEKDFAVNFVVTCSSSKEDLPEFVAKYLG